METQDKVYPILGDEGSSIDLEVAAEWTANHRLRHKGGLISHFFGKQILQQILSQPDCMGLRIYYANSKTLNGWQKFIISISNFLIRVVADAEGERHFIVTGVSKDGQDQLPPPAASKNNSQGHPQAFKSFTANGNGGNTLGEQSVPCPGTTGCPDNVLTGG
jgi:hypothetical protein